MAHEPKMASDFSNIVSEEEKEAYTVHIPRYTEFNA
jgi:hypothetical protein